MKLKEILAEIDRLKKELDNMLPMKREWQDRLDKKFRLEWNYNSNHIEGNTLTYGETELLLIFDKTTGDHEMREYEEMKAHDVALKIIYEMAKDKERPLNETVIKQLNEIILVRPFWKNAITSDGQETRRLIEVGDYKKHPNSVRLKNGEIFNYPSPGETPIQMGELIEYYNHETAKNKIHPLALAAMMHYKFVCIHPFDDGNGRTARLIMNYILLKNGLPPVIIKSTRKDEYLTALNKADVGDTDAFIEHIGSELLWSLGISIKAAKGEYIYESGDHDKQLELLQKKLGRDLYKRANNFNETQRIVTDFFVRLLFDIDSKNKRASSMFMRTRWSYLKINENVFKNDNAKLVNAENIDYLLNHISDVKKNDGFEYLCCLTFEKFKTDKNKFSFSLLFIPHFEDFHFNLECKITKPIVLTEKESEQLFNERDISLFCETERNIALNRVRYDDIDSSTISKLIGDWSLIIFKETADFITQKADK